MTKTPIPTLPARFAPGETVTCRSVCDHNCVWTFEVIKRTAKFITIQDVTFPGRPAEKPVRVGVKTDDNGEWAMPMGSYSMAPVIRAAH